MVLLNLLCLCFEKPNPLVRFEEVAGGREKDAFVIVEDLQRFDGKTELIDCKPILMTNIFLHTT